MEQPFLVRDLKTQSPFSQCYTYRNGSIGFSMTTCNVTWVRKLGRHVIFHLYISLILFLEQMCQLLASRNNLMKERKILCQEVEFLRKQWMSKTPSEPVTPAIETASNVSAENDDNGHANDEKERDAWHPLTLTLTCCDSLWGLTTRQKNYHTVNWTTYLILLFIDHHKWSIVSNIVEYFYHYYLFYILILFVFSLTTVQKRYYICICIFLMLFSLKKRGNYNSKKL